MMREILFRGKSTETGKWREGSLLNVSLDGVTYSLIFGDDFVRSGLGVTAMSHSCVYPETVGQYTGMTDKNRNRIFEGDIVYSIYSKRNYVVLFGEYTYITDYGDEESTCGWYNEEDGGYMTAFGSPENWALKVGNIHDNPELLDDGKGNANDHN